MSGKTAEVALSALALVFLVLLQPMPVQAASTLIQQNNTPITTFFGSTVVTVSFPSNVASGNVVVVSLTAFELILMSLSDSLGSSFTQAVTAANLPYLYMAIYYATLASSAPDTVTAQLVATNPAYTLAKTASIYIFEVSGVTTTGAATGHGTGTSASISTGPTAFQSGAFLVGMIGVVCQTWPCTFAVGPGFLPSTFAYLEPLVSGAQYSTSGVSSPTTFPATFSGGGYWVEVGLALNPIRAAAPVGGLVESVNKVGPLGPWLAVIAVVGCMTIVLVVSKKRR